MDRTTWSAISKDPEVFKKVGICAASMMLLLPTPIALGLINTDLETEAQRLQAKEPREATELSLPGVDDLLKLLTAGLGPSILYALSIVLFAIPSIGVLLSQAQLYIYFRPPNQLMPELHAEVKVSLGSVIIFAIIGLVSLALQTMATALLPVALAQYSRGKDLIPALDVMRNVATVMDMGVEYWKRASGMILAALGMFVATFVGLPWYVNLPVSFALSAVAFVSLVLSSRYALEHLTTEIAAGVLPPMPKED